MIRRVRPVTASELTLFADPPRHTVRRYPQQGCALFDISHNKDTSRRGQVLDTCQQGQVPKKQA